MGTYDAAVKVILSHCRQAALECFLGLDVKESEILELEALAERFGVIPRDLEDRITAMDSRRQLKEILRHALRVQSIDDVREFLG